MEYRNPQNTTFPSIDSPNPSTFDSLSRHAEWQHTHLQQLSSGVGQTGLEEAMWQMTLRPQETMGSPYPERPGEPDCAYYMRTGLCGFGTNCKFNHPPNRRLVAAAALRSRGEYPERIEQPECQYYLKTGTCKFGSTCKYHHPREKAGLAGSAQLNVLNFPLRPGEKDCAYYIRTGNCKFGVTCKFNHPQPVVSMRGSPMFPGLPLGSASAPQPYPTSLPAWPMARPPYLPPLSIAGPSNFAPVLIPPPQGGVSVQTWNPYHASLGTIQEGQQQALPSSYIFGAAVPSQEPVAMGLYPSFIPGHATMRLPTPSSPTSGPSETLYPERPGQPECQYYMRNGECRFGSQCRFHHPRDRSVSSQGSLMGLPLRPV